MISSMGAMGDDMSVGGGAPFGGGGSTNDRPVSGGSPELRGNIVYAGEVVRAPARIGPAGAPATDQPSMCAAAASAMGRNSPAAPGLVAKCNQWRHLNIHAGHFQSDAYAVDPALRVDLTDAGDAIIAGSPQLQAQRAALPVSRRRGFTMGVAVRSGSRDATYLAFLKPGLSDPELAAGFAIAMGGGTTGGASSGGGGPSTAVIAGAAVVGLGIIGAIVYKLRKRR